MKRLLCIVACLVAVVSGCEKKKEEPAPVEKAPPIQAPAVPPPSVSLLQEPIEATLVELPSQALPVWRQYRAARPTLVLLSQDPFLQRTPAELREEVNALLLNGTPEELAAKLAFPRPDPLLLPLMALDAALNAGLFSEAVWVIPATVAREQLNLEQLRRQLLDFGAVDEEEAQTFSLSDGIFSGTVRGTPFRAVHPDALPALDGPVVLHIDLSFFQPLYKGEIKTPLYPLLYDSLRKLRDSGWDTAAVTISHSNLSGDLPLAIRFISPDLTILLQDPGMIEEPPPLNWQRRSNALYLPNFFKTEKVRELYLEMEAELPDDPSVKYGLYQINRQMKEGARALEYLEQAVALDRVYALEYLQLAPVAMEKGRPDQALKMLRLAEVAMPDNPFISMQLAAHLIELKHAEQALKMLEELQRLPWSKVYYSDMVERLEAMKSAARETEAQDPEKKEQAG